MSLLSESSFLFVPIPNERSGDTPRDSISAISSVRPLTQYLPSTNRTSAILSSTQTSSTPAPPTQAVYASKQP
jgi:hypothetical protein